MGERTGGPLGTPALLVAAGGTLSIVQLPVLGAVGGVAGAVLGVAGFALLRGRVVDPSARRAATVAVVAWVVSLVGRTVPVSDRGDLPVWLMVAAAAAGAVAVGAAAVAGAREERARAHANLGSAWWSAAAAVVVCHGPVVVALVLSAVVDRVLPGVTGPAATLAVIAVLAAPLALLARAGWRSDVAPLRAGSADAEHPPPHRVQAARGTTGELR